MKKENTVVIYNSPSPALPGILSLKGRGERGISFVPLRKKVGATQKRRPFHGFTLIELLVVVLIIGILTAVAVPQYQKAVAKAQAWKQIQSILIPMARAGEIYYLENGKWPQTFAEFEQYGVSVPWTGTKKGYTRGVTAWRSEGDWSINIFVAGSNYAIFLAKVSGPYSGIALAYVFQRTDGYEPTKQVSCLERTAAVADSPKFDGKTGDFCQKVLGDTRAQNNYFVL